MTPSPPTALARWAFVTALVLLAGLGRFANLEARPLMHDEAQHAYYAHIFMKDGHYTHSPILHGPFLMLSTGIIYKLFGDSAATGRAGIALWSLIMIAAALALVPRRTRWMLAPLILVSPVLLYYSRFLRNEMIFCGLAMLGLLAFVRSLRREPGGWWWAPLWLLCWSLMLTVKENCLFVYAAGLTFLGVWLIVELVRPRQGRPSPRAALHALGRRVGRPAALATAFFWLIGLLAGLAGVLVIYGVTSEPQTFAPIANIGKSVTYWAEAQQQHRIAGDIHYYLPILVVYELPLLLLVVAGLVFDAAARGWRASSAHVTALVLWLGLWALWRNLAARGESAVGPSPLLARIAEFFHLAPNASLLVLGLCIVPLLVWSILCLFERRPLAGWMGWWGGCSFFQYAVAGEKVPWLAVYYAVPLYLAAAWLWAEPLTFRRPRARAAAWAVVILCTVLGLYFSVPLMGRRGADPRERIVYNHTNWEFQAFCNARLERWAGAREPLEKRRVQLMGAPVWPGVWYFRHCNYISATAEQIPPTTDLVLGEPIKVDTLMNALHPDRWRAQPVRMRVHWLAPWPQRENGGIPWSEWFTKWWRYYWFREVWTEPGGYDITALEPAGP